MAGLPPEPTDEDLDRAEMVLGLLDYAYTAVTPPHNTGAWQEYEDKVDEAITDLDEARHVIRMLMLQDAVDLVTFGLSPSTSWQSFYAMWGHRR